MLILAVDPGTTISAYIEWDGCRIHRQGIVGNKDLLQHLMRTSAEYLFIEQLTCMGQRVGQEVLDTALWSGRFAQLWDDTRLSEAVLVSRKEIKKHHKSKNDKEIRATMIAKYGTPGTKKHPGVTFGCKSHLWQAFALATWVFETNYFAVNC